MRFGKFAAFGTAAATVAVASVASLTLAPALQRGVRKSPPETPGRGLIVCVGEDTVLRAMPAIATRTGACMC